MLLSHKVVKATQIDYELEMKKIEVKEKLIKPLEKKCG